MTTRAIKKTSRRPPRRTGVEAPDVVRERILATFSARARRSGIRTVVMGELASELRMSAMTLYKHFASKDDLVRAVVDAWALELAAIEALEWDKVEGSDSALAVLLTWADAWTASLGKVSPVFFEDLQRDHPVAWRRFQALIEDRKQVAAKYLAPLLREDVHAGALLLLLDRLVMQAADPTFVEQLGISRREAVRAALAVWADGALRRR